MAQPQEIWDVYEHATGLMRDHPNLTAVGCAWAERDGRVYSLACGAVVENENGQPITAAEMARVPGDPKDPSSHAWVTAALASIRGCSIAREQLDRAIADLA